VTPPGAYEAAQREPVWNVEPADVAELIELYSKNPAAYEIQFERRVVRVRGRVQSVLSHVDLFGGAPTWSARS
jgi:hypothetical protein